MLPKNSSESLNTFIYLFSDVCRLGPKYESEGTKIWKTVKGVCRVLEPIFRMRKHQEVRFKMGLSKVSGRVRIVLPAKHRSKIGWRDG